jgi:hypothetical protein
MSFRHQKAYKVIPRTHDQKHAALEFHRLLFNIQLQKTKSPNKPTQASSQQAGCCIKCFSYRNKQAFAIAFRTKG